MTSQLFRYFRCFVILIFLFSLGMILTSLIPNSALEPQYSKYREKDGMKEYITYFFINSKKLEGAIQTSLERSIKETKLTIEEAKSISKFVNDELRGATTE